MARVNGEQPEMVVLELPKEAGATSVAVAGDFNDWSVQTHEMRRRDDGGFAITLELERGRTYCYRYWVDGERWENDWSADAYVPNEYGGDNSLLDLRDGSPRLQHKTPVAHEPPSVQGSAADATQHASEPAPIDAVSLTASATTVVGDGEGNAPSAPEAKPAPAANAAKPAKKPATKSPAAAKKPPTAKPPAAPNTPKAAKAPPAG